MLYIKNKIKIYVVPGYEEEWLIGYRLELVRLLLQGGRFPLNACGSGIQRLCSAGACAGLWSWVAICWCARAGDRNRELHDPSEFLSNGARTPAIISDFTAGLCSFWDPVPQQPLVNNWPFSLAGV